MRTFKIFSLFIIGMIVISIIGTVGTYITIDKKIPEMTLVVTPIVGAALGVITSIIFLKIKK